MHVYLKQMMHNLSLIQSYTVHTILVFNQRKNKTKQNKNKKKNKVGELFIQRTADGVVRICIHVRFQETRQGGRRRYRPGGAVSGHTEKTRQWRQAEAATQKPDRDRKEVSSSSSRSSGGSSSSRQGLRDRQASWQRLCSLGRGLTWTLVWGTSVTESSQGAAAGGGGGGRGWTQRNG